MNAGRSTNGRAAFGASPSAASASRRFVAEHLSALGADDEVVADFMLAVSELVTNAVQHGGHGDIVVAVDTTADTWRVDIATPAPLPEDLRSPEMWRLAASSASSGRGLGIVREVMDDVQLAADGSLVSLLRFRHATGDRDS